MNLMYRRLLEQGYSAQEAQDIVEEEQEFERLSREEEMHLKYLEQQDKERQK